MGPARPLLRLRALRLPARPDHHGQGPHLGLRADGRRDRLRPDRRAVLGGHQHVHPRAHVRRPPGRRRGGDGQPRRVRARGPLRPRARERGRVPRRCSRALRDIPIVGDVRGAGYFHAIELVKDQETKETFSDEESEDLLRGFLSGELYRRGLICRADDRGDPVMQLSPPLIAGPEQFAEIESVLRPVLDRGLGADRQRTRSGRLRERSGRRTPVLTVQSLVDDLGLELLGGRGGGRGAGPLGSHHRAARPHAVAVGRRAAADHRHPARHGERAARVRRAARPTTTWPALGFGTGFDHAQAAAGDPDEAETHGFPVFEVPYDVPFIAITEKAFTRLVNEQYEVLQRGIAIHTPARAADPRGARARRGDRARSPPPSAARCCVLERARRADGRQGVPARARAGRARPCAARWPQRSAAPNGNGNGSGAVAVAFAPEHPDAGGPGAGAARGHARQRRPAGLARGGARRRRPRRLRAPDPPAGGDRGGARAAAPARDARDTERRLAGDVLAEALTGHLDPERAADAACARSAIGDTAAVLVFSARRPGGGRAAARPPHARPPAPAPWWPCGRSTSARWSTPPTSTRSSSPRARAAALAAEHGEVRAAASRPAPTSALRRSYHEARCALEASALAGGDAPEVATYKDLGAFQLLLSSPGRGRAAALLRQPARPARERRGRLRRRADALARGLHRAERPVGAGRAPALLPPPHAALPDPPHRGADRPRPLTAHATGSSSGWRCAAGSWSREQGLRSRAGRGRHHRAGDRPRPGRLRGGPVDAPARPRRGARERGGRRARRAAGERPRGRRARRPGRARSRTATCWSTRPATGSTSTRCAPASRPAATTSTSAGSTS